MNLKNVGIINKFKINNTVCSFELTKFYTNFRFDQKIMKVNMNGLEKFLLKQFGSISTF